MLRLFKVIKEIKLYREYCKIIRNEELNSPRWSKANLRRDWAYRIYTVINLPPQVTMSPDFPEESKPSFVISEMKSVNEYLKYLNLAEILTTGIQPIEGTQDNSWLVIYQFLFREISWIWIFKFIFQLSLIIGVISYWSTILNFFAK
jgi:hypothetical protein